MKTLLLILVVLSAFANVQGKYVGFSFSKFSPGSCNGSLNCMGTVAGGGGYLSLTNEPPPPPPPVPGSKSTATPPVAIDNVGRVLFSDPMTVWPASFSTTFRFRISKFPNTPGSGDGMTFILASDNSPPQYGSYGSNLGLSFDQKILAVEFDTYKNDFEVDGNHVAIDTTSIKLPVAVKSLNSSGIDLKSGKVIKVQIRYHGRQKLLFVNMNYAGQPLMNILTQPIDISEVVPSSVYVGFTAATGAFAESHQLLSWSFISHPLPS